MKNVKQQKKVLVSGSLVYDTIFSLSGSIGEQIVLENGRIGHQNLMFTGKEKKVFFGGTGGNIAYGLSKLGIAPYLVSAVGKDFGEYKEYLKGKAELKVLEDKSGYTSVFYAMTDENGEQIGVFQTGVYAKRIEKLALSSLLSRAELSKIEVGIFAAGTAKSIVYQMTELRSVNKNAVIIFDPGQMLGIDFTKSLLEKALKVADIVIVNDVEQKILESKFGYNTQRILEKNIKQFVVTEGSLGSSLYKKVGDNKEKVFVKAKTVDAVDPTGAGDAFRAGFIDALLKGKSEMQILEAGNALGAKCVKKFGGQGY